MHDQMHRQMLSAGKRLAKREAAMSQALASVVNAQANPNLAVAACVDFFHEVVMLHYSDDLGSLADFLDDNDIPHGIGTRILDKVFEEGPISDAVVLELVRLFDSEPAFREAMIEQDWESSVETWRDAPPHPLPACAVTAELSIAPPPVSSAHIVAVPAAALPPMYHQGDLFAAFH